MFRHGTELTGEGVAKVCSVKASCYSVEEKKRAVRKGNAKQSDVADRRGGAVRRSSFVSAVLSDAK